MHTDNLFQRILYKDLNARQQEAYNFQKVSSVLADYGFVTIRLSSDWGGADFIAQHSDGMTFLKVQLKGRLTFDRKYMGHDLYICFPDRNQWFIYPHDELLQIVLEATTIGNTQSWASGGYSVGGLSKELRKLLEPYRLQEQEGLIVEE
jgi:hypothetical protein